MEIKIDDCSLYFKDNQTLCVSDLHLGLTYPEKPYPVMEHDALFERLASLIDEYQPDRIIFNGDVFSNESIDQKSISMFDMISGKVQELIFTIGNHEIKRSGYPNYIKSNFPVVESYYIDDITFHHGHNNRKIKSSLQVIGHEHPTLNGEDVCLYHRSESSDKAVIVTPKFTEIAGGYEVDKRKTNTGSPVIDDDYINNWKILEDGYHNLDNL